jgi:hypothetical protein
MHIHENLQQLLAWVAMPGSACPYLEERIAPIEVPDLTGRIIGKSGKAPISR